MTVIPLIVAVAASFFVTGSDAFRHPHQDIHRRAASAAASASASPSSHAAAAPATTGRPLGAPQGNPAPYPSPVNLSLPILNKKRFPWPNLPYQADTETGGRGPQEGYNICNSTTAGPNSRCQTLMLNSLSDFCLWGPPTPDTSISNAEQEVVAWCTQGALWGARQIPAGAITGAQFIITPSAITFTGNIDQTKINLPNGDAGGELDSGGQDERGNPIGGLVYSQALPGGTEEVPVQSVDWSNFIGGNIFCTKACSLTAPNAGGICKHTYDELGCNFNVPNSYTDGVFESCLGDDPETVGLYTGADGQLSTYLQADGAPPYTPAIPASSSCTTFASSDIFSILTALPGASTAAPSAATGAPTPISGAPPGGAAEPSTTATAPSSAQRLNLGMGMLVSSVAVLIGAAFVL